MSDELVPTEQAWTVVLRPDGLVDDIQGGAPVTWLGHSALTHVEIPDAVRAAAESILSSDPGSHWVRHRRVNVKVGKQPIAVDVIGCHALPLRRTHVVVRDMVLRVLDLFRQQAPVSQIEIQLEYSQAVPVSFPADGEKLTWAVSTLVGNALRYLQASGEAARRISILVDYEVECEELVIRVADNGPGVPLAQRRWLFERNPETGRPAGLALVMVKDVILAHRGSIDVASKPSGGTAITLRLPRFPM